MTSIHKVFKGHDFGRPPKKGKIHISYMYLLQKISCFTFCLVSYPNFHVSSAIIIHLGFTLPNVALENQWLEDEISLLDVLCSGATGK